MTTSSNKDKGELKLFLIKPYENWSYCGGGGAIIASNKEEVSKMLTTYNDEILVDFSTKEQREDGYYLWEVVETLSVQEDKPRIIFIDYNWG
jgi:hypothetical protein